MRKRLRIFAAVPLFSGVLVLATATGASAEPSENASCVAQFVHGPPGPPGQFQREAHLPRFGQNVSFVAHLPREVCTFGPPPPPPPPPPP
jgi:hypothetical protein